MCVCVCVCWCEFLLIFSFVSGVKLEYLGCDTANKNVGDWLQRRLLTHMSRDSACIILWSHWRVRRQTNKGINAHTDPETVLVKVVTGLK